MGADHTYQATNTSVLGGYARRDEEWRLQADLASRELDQVDKQIATADIRIEIAKQELKNHDAQIANSQQVADFLREKFTNEDLYSWMQGEISTIDRIRSRCSPAKKPTRRCSRIILVNVARQSA